MGAKVYVVPGSHPSMAGWLMLELKGIAYGRRDLIAAAHKPLLRIAGFAGSTVPAIELDGERMQETRTISRRLDELVPDPPLFPPTPRHAQRSRRPSAGTTRSGVSGGRAEVPAGRLARSASANAPTRQPPGEYDVSPEQRGQCVPG